MRIGRCCVGLVVGLSLSACRAVGAGGAGMLPDSGAAPGANGQDGSQSQTSDSASTDSAPTDGGRAVDGRSENVASPDSSAAGGDDGGAPASGTGGAAGSGDASAIDASSDPARAPERDGAAAQGLAPEALRVGDRERPLNVEGAPLFSWEPHDIGGDQLQTAYQIQVRLGTSGALAWDSDKVKSAEQSYIRCGGPALALGESYTWVVRTWNRDDVVSAWSATAEFDMGLTSDAAAWRATWIRRAPATSEDGLDEYTLARVERTVAPSPVRRARAYVSANHQYELHINGSIADRGPAFAYPGEAYYQASDITSLVQAGGSLAVGVLYHWYGAGQGRPAGVPGVLARIVVDHDDGTREVIVSDGTWRVKRASQWQAAAPRRSQDSLDFVEWIDMRQDAVGWDLPGFAATTGWTAPQVIGPHPSGDFSSVRGQEPRLRTTVVAPVSVRTLADGAVVADFGKIMPARPSVRFVAGAAGRVLAIVAGYRLASDGHVSTDILTTQKSDLSFRFTERAGAQEFRPMTYFGWRYLQISAPGETLPPSAITALVEHTDVPADRGARFESSDATLNSVFDLVQRSALYSVQQQFVDTPTREKGQFLIDAVNESFATMMAWHERDATQKAIGEFIASQARFWPDGRLNAIYPNGDDKRDIPDFTELFPTWLWRYYIETGDKALLARGYPVLQKIADYVWSYRDGTTGLITNLAGGSDLYLYGIVDWPEAERRGYDMVTPAHTSVNMLAVEVMRATAAAASALGRPPAEPTTYLTRATQLATSINARLRRADGIYVDGASGATASRHASQLASSYAIAFGIVPAANQSAVADYVAGMGMNQGPMTAHWLAKALADTERFDALLRLLTDRTGPGWANILSQGATFTWESWDAPVRGESESHGWGSQVVVDILETMLGVRVIGPGAATVGIRPPRTGPTFARGTVFTERGAVGADWARTTSPVGATAGATTGLTLKVDVPMNVRAEVALPATDVARTSATGEGAPRYRTTGGGWVIYDVGSGHSTFTTQ